MSDGKGVTDVSSATWESSGTPPRSQILVTDPPRPAWMEMTSKYGVQGPLDPELLRDYQPDSRCLSFFILFPL